MRFSLILCAVELYKRHVMLDREAHTLAAIGSVWKVCGPDGESLFGFLAALLMFLAVIRLVRLPLCDHISLADCVPEPVEESDM